MRSGQRTCTHLTTLAGDIVNYIPLNNADDVLSDAPGHDKLSRHFMLLLPAYYKPVQLQHDPNYYAALVISSNPIGPSSLLIPQPGEEDYKAENIPTLKTLVFDAHSRLRSLIVDDEVERQWVWKEHTSLCYQIKIVAQDHLHAVIFPNQPTYGLRLSDGAFQQVLRDLGEEEEELENARAGVVNGIKRNAGCAIHRSRNVA
ncbi:MAG: hypothetical protein Q9181_007647 [Wetmoreana brouardii]